MAENIKGITVKIGGDTTGLNDALKDVNKSTKEIQSELKQVDKLLKLDPSNVELLTQKQDLLNKAVSTSSEKLNILEESQKQVNEQYKKGEIPEEAYRVFQRELAAATIELDKNEDALEQVGKKTKTAGAETDKTGESLKKSSKIVENSGKKFDAFASIMKGVSSAVKTVGAATAVAAASAAAATIKLGTEVIQQFGELEQNLGGSEAVFQDYAENMQKIGEDAYKNMGITQSQYLATANKMGALFQGSGLEVQQSADLTEKAMQRAADMASVMGIDMQVALDSVAGAAKGNYTMMDNLGIAMNATSIEAYAVAKGLDFVWASASQAEKTEVAMQMFFENTQQYAGNFAKESTQTISGSIGLMQAALGSFTAGLGNANADISNLTKNVVDAFQAVVANIVPVIQNIVKTLPTAIAGILPAFSKLLPLMLGTISNLFSQILRMLLSLLPDLIPVAIEGVETISQAIIDNLPLIISAGAKFMVALINGIATSAPQIIPTIQSVVFMVGKTIIENLPAIMASGNSILDGLIEGIINSLPGLKNVLNGVIDGITAKFPALKDTISMIETIFERIKDTIISAFTKITESGVIGNVITIITNFANFVTTSFTTLNDSGIFETLSSLFSDLITVITDTIAAASNSTIFESLTSIFDQLSEKIQILMPDFEGLGDFLSGAFSTAIEVISNALKFVADNFDIISTAVITATTAFVTYKGAMAIAGVIQSVTTALNGMTIGQYALNLAMKLNPIGIVVGLIAALAAGFIYLWNTNEDFREALISAWEKIKATAIDVWNWLIKTFTEDIPNAIKNLIQWFKDLPGKISDTFEKLIDKVKTLGGDIISGLWEGINNAKDWLMEKIGGFFGGIVDNIKDFFGIHSPSTLMRDEVGKPIGQGAAQGITDSTPDAARASANLANAIQEPLSEVPQSVDAIKQSLLDMYNAATRFEKINMSKFESLFGNTGAWNNLGNGGEIVLGNLISSMAGQAEIDLSTANVSVERFTDLVYGLEREITTWQDASGRTFQAGNMPGYKPEMVNGILTPVVDEEYWRKYEEIKNTLYARDRERREAERWEALSEGEKQGELLTKQYEKQLKTVSDLEKELYDQRNRMMESGFHQSSIDAYERLRMELELAQRQLNATEFDHNRLAEAIENGTVESFRTLIGTSEEADAVLQLHADNLDRVADTEARIAELQQIIAANGFVPTGVQEKLIELALNLEVAKTNLEETTKAVLGLEEAMSNSLTDTVKEGLQLDIRNLHVAAADFESWGEYCAQMLSEGIQIGFYDENGDVIDATKYFTEGIKETIQEGLDIHSPSGFGKWIGEMLDSGVAGGIISGLRGVLSSVGTVTSAIKDRMINDTNFDTMASINDRVNAAYSNIYNNSSASHVTNNNPIVNQSFNYPSGTQPPTRYQQLQDVRKAAKAGVRVV